MASDIEMFNQHQQDARNRFDSLVRAVFVISSGALTISIGIFLNRDASEISKCTILVLQISWWLLFVTIILGVLSLYGVLMRDSNFGELWRNEINGQDLDVSGKPGKFELVIRVIAHLGLLSFIFGMLGLAYVATATVSVS